MAPRARGSRSPRGSNPKWNLYPDRGRLGASQRAQRRRTAFRHGGLSESAEDCAAGHWVSTSFGPGEERRPGHKPVRLNSVQSLSWTPWVFGQRAENRMLAASCGGLDGPQRRDAGLSGWISQPTRSTRAGWQADRGSRAFPISLYDRCGISQPERGRRRCDGAEREWSERMEAACNR